MGTLALFVGSIFIVSTPTAASAAVTKQFTYACATGGPFTNTSITVGLSAPDTVAAGQSFDLTVNIPALTLGTAATSATTVQATMALTPTGGTVSDAGAKAGAAVTAGQTAVPAGSVTYKIAVAAGTTTKVSVKPGELKLGLTAPAGGTTSTCTTTSTEALDVPIGTGGGGDGTDIVAYDCTLPSTSTDTNYPADVDIKVVLTPPTSAAANADASITWAGTIQTTGDTLKAPTGFPTTGGKLFATIKASGAGSPATATGEAALTSVTIGQDITLPTSVTIKVKPTTTGTVTLTAGDLAFGTSSTSPAIKCTAPTTGLKGYTFTVGNASTSPSSSPTPSSSNTSSTPKPTTTSTATVTVTPPESTKKSKTPKAGADTGAGGTMGPDGRMFILTGGALIAAAVVGGLVMRRRNAARG
ncbi:hypothetical protein [Nonomuraea basaltis]|uniref:hypothetical protein n=1 Tax=Nonomuraea basaltis TaxID=2495887 RepID=UPI00110C710E|nr:hypothetical protein [Nonomuraea basaltis]TMR95655.1 hypothetical protein EJK15_27645 [Nonomuraea basaltis]